MKNSTILKKINSLIILWLFLTGSVAILQAQTTITSSASGGNWKSTTTWIGGVVPAADNNVVINSAVYVNGDVSCNNLTVNAGSYLYNTYPYNSTVSVDGSVINNGSMLNNAEGYILLLNIKGNIENNGVWNFYSTTLSGLADQQMKQAPGKKFEGVFAMTDSLGAVVLGSDIMMNGNAWDLKRSTIKTNGHRLLSYAYTLHNGYIESNDSLILNETVIANLNFRGNYKLGGKVYSQNDNIFNGTLTVIDSLVNRYAWTNTAIVKGTLINNGVIMNNPKGYAFSMNIEGDVQNNGIWKLYSTVFSGTADNHVQQSAGKMYEGIFSMSDSIGSLVLNSDVLFSGNTFDLNKTTLRTNGFKLKTKDYTLRNGSVLSNDTLLLENTTIESLKFFGDYKLDGNILSQAGNVFYDHCTIIDTLYNRYTWDNTIAVKGNITNKGTVTNNPGGYVLRFDVSGNIRNEGIWNLNTTNFVGKADQTIEQNKGKRFEGIFNTTDSIGNIILASDVLFENNTWNMNKANLRTNGHKLLSKNYTLTNGKIISNDSLKLDHSVIQNMKFFGDYVLDGNVLSQSDNIFYDNCTIIDTLYNNYPWDNTIQVKGNILNKGTVMNNPAGYILRFDVSGNIRNEGIWKIYTTNFVGNTNQTMEQKNGKRYEGIFNTTDSIGDIILLSDVALEGNTWNMNKANLRTNGHRLITNNYTLTNGKIISNDSLKLDHSVIQNMKLFGDYVLDGNVLSQSDNIFYGNCTIIDTLYNKYPWNNTIQVKGNMINKGTVTNNPGGYVLRFDVTGNIRNEGIWNLNTTNFVGNVDQTIEQKNGKRFEGIFNTTDSIGDIILASDVLFENNTWNMNKANLRTNGHKLLTNNYTLTYGKIISNDTLVLNNTIIERMQYFGSYKLDGNVYSQNNNVFNDTLTVLDTLTNRYAWNNTILINGDLVNKGSVINNPAGYVLNLQLKGNLTNHNIFSISNIYLTGNKPRTISGSNASGIQTTIFIDDSVHLKGNNTLTNISFTSNPNAYCIIDPNATLTLTAISNPARILNYGRISLAQNIDNTIPNTLSFYESSINSKAGIPLNKLAIDHYGYQQHPTASGTVNCWWRLRNAPQSFKDSLAWLKLNYKTDALNGNLEDSLKVYHSANAGLNWNRIKKGVSIDKLNHITTISNAPSYGHFLLSTTSTGIYTFHPMIETVEPKFGGNSGFVTLYIFGAGLKNTSVAKLKISGQTDIVADTTYITDAIGESMLARFDLKNKNTGTYDVVVETPGESTLIKTAYFTVNEGQRSNPWVSLSGRDRFLLNRWQTFNLNYGNTANVDANGTVLVYVVNDLPGLEVTFPDIKVVLPKGVIELGADYTRIADSVAIFYVTDSLTGHMGQRMRVYPFYIPTIAAGSSNDVRVKVKLTGVGTLKMSAWMMDPLFEKIDTRMRAPDPMPSEVRACITLAAMRSFASGVSGFIPGAGCYNLGDKLVDKFVDPVGYLAPQLKPEDAPNTWGSWLWSGVSWAGSITQCATSFMPGLGQAVSLGIGITNMMIDIKDGSNTNEGCWRKFKKKSESLKNSNGVTSFDPNEIVGPHGFTSENYISSKENISYRIYFENKKTAGASALEVFVKDTLDISKFDLSTFSFNSISFAETTIRIQEYAKEFTVLVDLYPKKNIIVQVHGVLDNQKGIISWDFHSLDRVTLELTEDPDLGFLPPNNNSPEGEGNVAFSCKLKETVLHDDILANKASIVFDFNAPLTTNTYTNKIDLKVPVSTVDQLNPTQTDSVFTVSWSGNDQGSGIKNYNIFVSENDSSYILWKASTNTTSAILKGKKGHSYKFYCIVSDSVGLTESQKLNPEAVTSVLTKVVELNIPLSKFQLYPNPASEMVNMRINLTNSKNLILNVYNGVGTLIRTEAIQPNQEQLNIKNLSDGIYMVEIKSKEWSEIQKLIIQR